MTTALDLILRMGVANATTFRAELNAIQDMPNALQPVFEGTENLMEEGMVYVMFSSSNNQEIDSVWRIFFLNIPAFGWCEIDVFLISENLTSYHWNNNFFGHFQNLSPNTFHQEFANSQISFAIDGSWNRGYNFKFWDIQNDVFADIHYEHLSPHHVLTYANGKFLTTHRVSLKAYDMFGVKARGRFRYGNQHIRLNEVNTRGLVEHGLGIYLGVPTVISTWFNLHYGENSLQVFVYNLALRGGDVEFGEAALVHNVQWEHYLYKQINLRSTSHEYDVNIGRTVPTEWTLSIGPHNNPVIKVSIRKTAHLAWKVVDHYVVDYVLAAKGTYKSQRFQAKGTMEVVLGL